MIDKVPKPKDSLINPSASGLGQPEGLSYPFPRGFNSPHQRYWESFAYHLRYDPVSLSVLAEMLAEHQGYRDNMKQRKVLDD